MVERSDTCHLEKKMEIYLETYKSNEVYEEKKADFQHFLGHGLVRFALDDNF